MNGTGKEVAGKLNFGKIFKLFDDAHSADLYDRQVAVVTRVSDNKFELEGGDGQKGPPYVSSFVNISNWSYADAE